jgi:outer membrane biosynthesis protein TonB
MRAARAAAALAAVGSLALAAPAMAWDEQECADWYAEHGTVHEDCQSPPPPPEEEQPPVAPSPTPAPPVPASPPQSPATPPQSPAAPEAPPTPPEQAPEKQGKPDRGPRASTKGKQEQRSGGAVQAQPAATVTQTESATAGGTLPYTGVPAGLLGLGGAGLAAAGAALRRRVS